MAQVSKRLSENIPGEFFVDDTCIDCDACRAIAPETFRDHGGQSSVYRQPADVSHVKRALMALISCPTASIGSVSHRSARAGVDAFPEKIADNVLFCGFTSERSFGGWSYLVIRPPQAGGNILVDSPRFSNPLVKRIEQLGGIATMFLSHRDDIADHSRFAAHFQCPRIMHEGDGAARLGVEQIISGEDPIRLDADFLVIPAPGHTRGHQLLLYRDQFLFTGDHLAWSPERNTLTAFRDHCWYSWPVQTRSMERLLAYSFFPGHGRIGHASAPEMRDHLQRCVAWMRQR